MNIFFTVIVVFLLLVAVGSQFGLLAGSKPQNLGAQDNLLKAPSKNENSVSSQSQQFKNTDANTEYSNIEAIKFTGNSQDAFIKLKMVIAVNFKEAKLVTESQNYLYYEFKTGLLKYTDDIEFLVNESKSEIDFRSASRLGRKDFGKNRSRMEEIRLKFQN